MEYGAYGNLEKHLGRKFAQDLARVGIVHYQEIPEQLENSLAVLAMLNASRLKGR